MHPYCVLCSANSNIQVHIIKPGPGVIVQSKCIINAGKKGDMYSQFFQVGEVLEHVCWKLSDVVHAQVTVENQKSVRIQNQICFVFMLFIGRLDHRRQI